MKGVLLDFSRQKGDPLALCMCPNGACIGNYPYGSVCRKLNDALRATTGKPLVKVDR